jgi:hypothetical protein
VRSLRSTWWLLATAFTAINVTASGLASATGHTPVATVAYQRRMRTIVAL